MGETDTRREPRTVLVVDDDGDARRLLCYALELDGYATEDAASGEQALIAYERLHPDAILLDQLVGERMCHFTLHSDALRLCHSVACS